MDLNAIGIGAIIGATFVAGTNLYIFMHNNKKAEIKERIEKLYSPLYVYYLENMIYGSGGSYEDYLALKNIYIGNSIYASDMLKELFEELLHKESGFMDLPENERAMKMNSSLFRDEKSLEKDLNNMIYRIGGWIDREHDELQVYYAKGMIGRFLWRLKIHNNPSCARGALPAGRSFL